MRSVRSVLLVAALVAAFACGDRDRPPGDGGPRDAARSDGGRADAGIRADGGPTDAGAPSDAGMDASTDASVGSDAGPDAGPATDGGEPPALVTRRTVACGNGHTCAIDGTGGVRCWGHNDYGQLGLGSTTDQDAPTVVPGITNAVALTAGHSYTCATLASGAARCWGENGSGQLGSGGVSVREPSPLAVVGLTNIVWMEAFWVHTCALLDDRSARCFGANEGRLGNGGSASSSAPVSMVGVFDAIDVGTGWGHSCVALATGGVQCNGTYNNWGQVGDGTMMTRYSPVDVLYVDDAVALGIGSYHSCVITARRTVQCWGSNQGGSLGIGTRDDMAHTAVDVPGLTDVVQLRGGSATTCALHADGTLSCWGVTLGSGGGDVVSSPAPLAGVTDAIEVELGTDHACLVLSTGQIRCWGWNGYGQLGDGTTTDTLTPIAVAGTPF